MADLTVVILTFNETVHIGRAIQSVQSFAKRIIVVDSFSSDNTAEIASELGAEVFYHEFVNHSVQLTWALENSNITTAWTMRLDADEVIGEDLADTLESELPALPADVSGINLKRRHIFMERWIKRGGRYPLLMIRIWRTGSARVEDTWMDEHILVKFGRTVLMEGYFADHNLKSLSEFTSKHNSYATREAVQQIGVRYGLWPSEDLESKSTSYHVALTKVIKIRVFQKLPFWIASPLYLCYRLFILGGILDGVSGIIYHVLQGFWYRFLVGAKINELESRILVARTDEDRRYILAQYSGLKLG